MNNLDWLKENNGICFIDSLYNEPALTVSVNNKVTQVPLDSPLAKMFLSKFVTPTIESIKNVQK
jgi:hypothetical protein